MAPAPTSTPWTPCVGCRSPSSFNNPAVFTVFAILGLALVLGSLWFFFHARNGGFQYHAGDFSDYKTVVMRRSNKGSATGSDGRTAYTSGGGTTRYGDGMTVVTGLGGHVKGAVWDDGRIARGGEGEERARWAALSVVARDEKGRKGIMAKRGWAGTHSAYYKDDFTDFGGARKGRKKSSHGRHKHGKKGSRDYETDSLPSYQEDVTGEKEHSDDDDGYYDDQDEHRHKGTFVPAAANHGRRYRDRDAAAYKREQPARVGGINRAADGTHLDHPSSVSGGAGASSVSDGAGSAHGGERRKKAMSEADRMERRWRKEAALRAASGEGGGVEGATRTPSPVKRQQQRMASGRGYTFSEPQGKDAQGQRQSSYYDAYRPRQ